MYQHIRSGADNLLTRILEDETFLATGFQTLVLAYSVGICLLGFLYADTFCENLVSNRIPQDVRDAFFRRLTVFSLALTGYVMLPRLLELLFEMRGRRLRMAPLFHVIPRLRFLVVAFFLPILLNKAAWSGHRLLYLVILGGVAACLPNLLSAFFSTSFSETSGRRVPRLPPRPAAFLSALVLGLGIVAYTAYFGYYTILNHYQFGTHAYDLGLRVNYFWNTIHGRFLHCSYAYPQYHYFAVGHLTLTTILLLGPLYYLCPRAELFLAAQAGFLALGALPLYLIARRAVGSHVVALAVACCYLLNPALHAANFFDFHELCFVPLVGGMLFYAMLCRRTAWYWLFLPLFLLIKEDMALLLVCSSFSFLPDRSTRAVAARSIVIAGLWYLVAMHLILPRFGYRHFGWNYTELTPYQGAALEVLKSTVTNPLFVVRMLCHPDRITYVLQALIPLAFVPLLRKRYLPLFAYGSAVSLLATRPFFYITFQYVWYWLTGVFVAFILVVRDTRLGIPGFLSKLNWRALVVAAVLTTLALSYQYGAVLNAQGFRGGYREIDFRYTPADREALRDLHDLVQRHIPPHASVAAAETICPHVSNRREVYTFRCLAKKVDYILLFSGTEEDAGSYRHYITSGDYVTLVEGPRFTLYERRDRPTTVRKLLFEKVDRGL
jgi:uncharacterized membrane protein